MGRLMSSGFGRGSRPGHDDRSDPAGRVLASSLCEHRKLRWRHGRLVGLPPPAKHPRCRHARRYRTLFGDLRASWSAKAEHRRSEGSSPSGADHRATTLYSVGPRGPDHDAVMRISGEAPGRRAHSRKRCRHHAMLRVTANSDRQRRPVRSCSPGSEGLSAFSFHAARKTTPAGTSPVVTIRHSAISSFLASATIRVLRVPPRASAVRARYHCASALSFWSRRKRHANWIIPRRTRALSALASERAEQAAKHRLGQAASQEVPDFRFEVLKRPLVQAVGCPDHTPAGHRREDGDSAEKPSSSKARKQPRWNAIARAPPPESANPMRSSPDAFTQRGPPGLSSPLIGRTCVGGVDAMSFRPQDRQKYRQSAYPLIGLSTYYILYYSRQKDRQYDPCFSDGASGSRGPPRHPRRARHRSGRQIQPLGGPGSPRAAAGLGRPRPGDELLLLEPDRGSQHPSA